MRPNIFEIAYEFLHLNDFTRYFIWKMEKVQFLNKS